MTLPVNEIMENELWAAIDRAVSEPMVREALRQRIDEAMWEAYHNGSDAIETQQW